MNSQLDKPLSVACWTRNFLYAVALLLASPYLLWRSLSTGRYRSGWSERLLGPKITDEQLKCVRSAVESQRPIVWLHGVSVGEVLLLGPLITRLQQQYTDAVFCVSSTTDTGIALAGEKFPNAIVFRFPFDFSWAVRRVIQQLQPSVLLLAELELWPNLLAICDKNNIPIAVVNGRLSERSCRGYQRLRWVTKPMFSRVDLVCAASQDYAERFAECGTPTTHIFTTGSIKFDNVSFSRESEPILALRELAGLTSRKHNVLLAGSTQVEEERIAIDAYFKLRKPHTDLKLIVAPRHPERTSAIVDAIKQHEADAQILLRTELSQPVDSNDWDVLVINCVGELSRWWGVADIALVGGSFGARGGQNMIEPAAFGCNVVFGPSTRNFRDVVRMLIENDAATELSSEDEFVSWLSQELANPAPGRARATRAIALIRQQQGALDHSINRIVELLDTALG